MLSVSLISSTSRASTESTSTPISDLPWMSGLPKPILNKDGSITLHGKTAAEIARHLEWERGRASIENASIVDMKADYDRRLAEESAKRMEAESKAGMLSWETVFVGVSSAILGAVTALFFTYHT